MPDNSAKIATIREILESGISSTSVDGVATSIDRESLRKELARLIAEDDSSRRRRPVASSIDFSNVFQ